MATATEHYNLVIAEGDDLVNPLTQIFPNFESIDDAMYANKVATIQNATELVSLGIHAITRTDTEANFIHYTATGDYQTGDTFTVDGVQVNAYTTDGNPLGAGAFVTGSEVFGYLNGTRLTLYVTGAAGSGSIDADTLDGHTADYFAVAADTPAKSVAYSVQIPAAQWEASGDAFTQTVSVADVTATNNIVVAPNPIYWDSFAGSQIRATSQGEGYVTFTAKTIPEAAVYANVLIIG